MKQEAARLTREELGIKGMHCASCALTIEKALKSLPGVTNANVDPVQGRALIEYEEGRVTLGEIVKAVRAVGYDVALDEVILNVEGLRSVDDERLVESVLLSSRGVAEAYASSIDGRVVVRYNPASVSVEKLLEKLRSAGYKATPQKGEAQSARGRDERQLLRQAVLAIAASVSYFAFLVLEKLGVAPWLGELLSWYGALVMAAVIAYSGRDIYRAALRGFLNLSPGMDSLVALGTGAIYIYSLAVTLGLIPGEVYYEGIGFIIGFVLLGRYLEARVKKGTASAVEKLAKLRPQKARVLKGRKEVEVDVSEIKPGDVVVVRQGERVPVDGRVVAGRGFVDESIFTGEPVPVEKKPGDTVLAGTLLISGWLHVAATRVGQDTAIERVARLVAMSQASKMEVQRLADRIAGVFAWIVMGVSAGSFTIWLLLGAPLEKALIHGASVLLVACPCALGLATPTATTAGVGVAAKAGILVRNAASLEKLAKATEVAFDKTGTLTMGRPRVYTVSPASGLTVEAVIEYAGSAEKWSEHPLAKAIIEEHIRLFGRGPRDPEEAEYLPGMGVYAVVSGKTVLVGNEKLMKGFEVDVSPLREAAYALASKGATVVYVAIDGKPAGVVAIRDEPRPEARETVEWLKTLGLKVVMLTGDQERTARAIAAELGIEEVRAGLSPEDKAEVIREMQAKGEKVVMVGDGVNDAPALSRADIGIAVASATEVSAEAGDILLVEGDLRRVPLAVVIARRVYRTIMGNLAWAFIYNVILIPVAAGALSWAGVVLRPELAAAAMALSSVSVTLWSYRLSRWKPTLPGDTAEEAGETGRPAEAAVATAPP